MQESLDLSLVRFRTADGYVVGAGFLVGERHILTCAHVVAGALGLADDTPEKPQDPVSLDFPRVAPKQLLTARVVLWRPPRADGGDDLAGLELDGDPPHGTQAAPLAQVEDLWGHSFRAFGFPRGQDSGVWSTGQLLGRQVTNWVQIEDVKETGFAVEPGFSGTPVWDPQVEAVVGMVVAAEKRMNLKTAFAIPVDVLARSWPLLESLIHPFVFLCYARADSELVTRLKSDLLNQGIQVWIDREGLQPGTLDWEEALRTTIRAAQAVLLIASPNARSSRYVRDELRIAEMYQRPIYPLWIAGTQWMDAVPLGWGGTQYIDARESRYETAMPELVGILNNSTISGNTVTVNNTTNFHTVGGAGIDNEGTLTITNSTISGNTVTAATKYPAVSGGGILNEGTLTITNSTISGNTAPYGGGILNDLDDQAAIINSTISGNTATVISGGGIDNVGTFTITNSTISGNTATSGDGGGIDNNAATLIITNSIISGNTVINGNGGGISNSPLFSSSSSMLTLTNSTISGNTVINGNGGGISNSLLFSFSSSTLTLTNSTISGNMASRDGGGIDIQSSVDTMGRVSIAQVDLTFSTIYGNTAHSGGDIMIEDVTTDSNGNQNGKAIKQISQTKIRNSIVAGDPAHPSPDIVGMLTSYGYNLFQDNSGATFDSATSSQHGTDKTLSVNDLTTLFADPVGLRNNGGPTRTYALAPGSPALDAIPLQYCQIKGILNNQSHLYIDQRGMKRPDGNEAFCDIGAYEYVDAPT